MRIHLRRMQWLLNDESGGIGWRFPEAMGEIIYHRPNTFSEFVPILIALFDMKEEDVAKFRAGTLWAIGRIAQVRPIPDVDKLVLPWIIPCLDDPNPQTRGMAVWCMGKINAAEHLADYDTLLADKGPVVFYSDGQIIHKSVAELDREALEMKGLD